MNEEAYDAPSDLYEDLDDLVSFANFHFADYKRGELEVLQPQMEAQGFRQIEWRPGETDSFGPLTRVCHAVDRAGNRRWFIYG